MSDRDSVTVDGRGGAGAVRALEEEAPQVGAARGAAEGASDGKADSEDVLSSSAVSWRERDELPLDELGAAAGGVEFESEGKGSGAPSSSCRCNEERSPGRSKRTPKMKATRKMGRQHTGLRDARQRAAD